jgi:phage terminase large subunit
VNGFSRVIQGKRHNGYSLVDVVKLKFIESGKLPNNCSIQIYEFNQVLKFLKDKEKLIYTDSEYAFRVTHTFGKMWAKRWLINSEGQDMVHKELIIRLPENLMLPEEIAIVHVPGHQ